MGWIESRQLSQTGRREIRTRGAPHMRQSAGNSVAKRLSAISVAHETKRGPLATVLACVARVRSQLLLKTTSRHPEGTLGPPARRISPSIAASRILMQCADDPPAAGPFPYVFPSGRRPWPMPPSLRHQSASRPGEAAAQPLPGATTAGNSRRTVRDAGKTDATHIFRGNFEGAKHTPLGCRNYGSGTP